MFTRIIKKYLPSLSSKLKLKANATQHLIKDKWCRLILIMYFNLTKYFFSIYWYLVKIFIVNNENIFYFNFYLFIHYV